MALMCSTGSLCCTPHLTPLHAVIGNHTHGCMQGRYQVREGDAGIDELMAVLRKFAW